MSKRYGRNRRRRDRERVARFVAETDANTDRLFDGVAAVRTAAAEVYTPEGVEMWLWSRNTLLDGRSPMSLIASGEHQRVLNLIDAMAEGVFL